MTPTREQILAASAGWVAVLLNVIPGLGAGYLYQRRWKAYWITSALATAWFVAGALLGQNADADAAAEAQNQLVGLIGLLLLAAVTATEAGLERLVFVLNESADDVRLPPKALNDPQYGQRQQAFLERVRNSGVTVQRFSTPETLQMLLERSLRQLADRSAPKSAVGVNATVAARPVPKYLPHMADVGNRI